MYQNKPMVLDLTKANTDKKSVQLDIPDDAVPGSPRAEVSVTGEHSIFVSVVSLNLRYDRF